MSQEGNAGETAALKAQQAAGDQQGELGQQRAGIDAGQLDAVVFYEKPLLKFERILETSLAFAPRGFGSFLRSMPQWLQKKLHLPREIDAGLGGAYAGPLFFTTHHESHAASAFHPSPFEEAAILTLDGVGEWTTASWGVGQGNTIELRQELRFPHSLGLLYSAFTYHCGFRVNSGEYKLMGLAPYGVPRFKDLILERLVRVNDDGSFWMDQRYFNYCAGLTMTGPRFSALFEGPPRDPESRLTQREMDMAARAGLQRFGLQLPRHRFHRQLQAGPERCRVAELPFGCHQDDGAELPADAGSALRQRRGSGGYRQQLPDGLPVHGGVDR
jgi:predicted NodU family carbamoyl transferase